MEAKVFDSKLGPVSVRASAPDQVTINGDPFTLNRVAYSGFGVRVTFKRGFNEGWFVTGGPFLTRANGNWKQGIPHTATGLVIVEARRIAALAAEDSEWLLDGEASYFDGLIAAQETKIEDAREEIRTILRQKMEFLDSRGSPLAAVIRQQLIDEAIHIVAETALGGP
jgi:hypothetical protein